MKIPSLTWTTTTTQSCQRGINFFTLPLFGEIRLESQTELMLMPMLMHNDNMHEATCQEKMTNQGCFVSQNKADAIADANARRHNLADEQE